MEKVKMSHPFFLELIHEHNQIQKKLNELTLNPVNLEELIKWFWEFVELNHHAKEEKILFHWICKNPRLCEGGPLCTFYFDYHVNDQPVHRVEKTIDQKIELSVHQAHLIENNSPLKIPLSEHLAGHGLLRYLQNNASTLTQPQKMKLLLDYKRIQLEHLAKEESCFFHLCANLLTVDEADQLHQQWLNEPVWNGDKIF